jgi:hypothetical protein
MSSPKLTLHKYEYLWISIVDNQYFRDIVNLLLYKYNNEAYKNTIILIGGNYIGEAIAEYRAQYPDKHLIVYNWEQLCDGNQWLNIPSYCQDILKADEIWDYDQLNSDYLHIITGHNANAIHKFDYIPDLERHVICEKKDIDVLFAGLLNQRRASILSDLHLRDYNQFNIVAAMGTSVDELDSYIARSKIVLNIHGFYPYSRQEQSRIGLLLANHTCVVSEPSQVNHFGLAIVETPDIYESCKQLLESGSWREQADRGYSLYKMGVCEGMNSGF